MELADIKAVFAEINQYLQPTFSWANRAHKIDLLEYEDLIVIACFHSV